ncbi:nuclear transport factor 2 family protein [Marinibaculum pumilum]|uniref:Nuclear transport factor 2 family protein n=1 Tax=Marinibaculum pumilum TaxID=1766165 RepID=A0ABV7L4Q2_9PROT
MTAPAAILCALVAAFGRVDRSAMAELMDPEIVAHVTNAAGGTDRIAGREPLLQRIAAFDYGAARLALRVTNSVEPAPDQALAMVEVRAARSDGVRLHNHAAHLCRVRGGRIVEWWMVDALPAESDSFWRGA